MSNLQKLIKNAKPRDYATSTIRIPKEMNSFIIELSDYLNLSKHETMLELIKEGIKIAQCSLESSAEEELKKSENNNFYLLNTNKSNDMNDQNEMISRKIAAAFYSPWKFNIDRIKKDDIVFLYGNCEGIVAYGKASGEVIKEDRYGDKDECYYQKLNDFTEFETPISAAEIKKILGRSIPFLRTLSNIYDGKKILDKITQEK